MRVWSMAHILPNHCGRCSICDLAKYTVSLFGRNSCLLYIISVVCHINLTNGWMTVLLPGHIDTRQAAILMVGGLQALYQSPSWQRALRYAPLFPSAIGPISRFLKNHEKGIIKRIIINHALSYDNITLNLFLSWLICENSANNGVVMTWIICCGGRRNLV